MTQVELDLDTKNTAIGYVKTVSMELFYQKNFEIFTRQVSPNLMNRIHRNLLELLTSPKLSLVDGALFKDIDGNRDQIMKEIFELSKLLVLQERSFQSIVFNEGDECDGLFIL